MRFVVCQVYWERFLDRVLCVFPDFFGLNEPFLFIFAFRQKGNGVVKCPTLNTPQMGSLSVCLSVSLFT